MTSLNKPPFNFKTQYSLGFSPLDDEIVVDFFCGGGGAGTGLEMGLGRAVSVAKNHSPHAISMHTVNHPGAKHFTTDVFDGDPDTECGGKPFTITQQVHMCGNSVSPPPMCAIAMANDPWQITLQQREAA